MESGDVANPFDDAAVASRYEGWYAGRGRRADELETELLEKLLRRFPAAESILEVGCGTGHFTRWFAQKGFDVVGLDVSEAMLREARRLGGPMHYVRADALALPFADRSYDLTAMITTLEFLADPARALAEAVRVARQGILLGVLNRWSMLTLHYRLSGNPLWRSARFFGPRELARLVGEASGRRGAAVAWRTTLWPVPGVHDSSLPWGGLIGMAVPLQEAVNA
jgi:ubiquinone/menaquinone biosynthesis C-methylase UbiE